tara:strand:- start:651 stop:899 length:249 start_codon:yes stop_codon:yes gene_type:complete
MISLLNNCQAPSGFVPGISIKIKGLSPLQDFVEVFKDPPFGFYTLPAFFPAFAGSYSFCGDTTFILFVGLLATFFGGLLASN